MAGEKPPQRPDGPGAPPPGAGAGWAALSDLISGMVVWGFIGWLVDRWLDTDGIAFGIGVVLGGAGGVYLVARRFGR
jgi:ATP synthase protein I